MNPSIDKAEHVLAIDDRSNVPDLDTVVDTHDFYRLRKAEALAELDRLRGVMRGWERRAKTLGLPAEDRLALRGGLQV
jgi:serine/threonine-protein kinase HipA